MPYNYNKLITKYETSARRRHDAICSSPAKRNALNGNKNVVQIKTHISLRKTGTVHALYEHG